MVLNTSNVTFQDANDVFSSLSDLLNQRKTAQLQDFDTHLDDPANDWRNLQLLDNKKKIQ
jgi:hypothetical protein